MSAIKTSMYTLTAWCDGNSGEQIFWHSAPFYMTEFLYYLAFVVSRVACVSPIDTPKSPIALP